MTEAPNLSGQAELLKELRHRAEVAEAAAAAIAEQRDAAREDAADARSTLSAWFDLATKAEEAVTPILLEGLKGYLRTAKSGGMPAKQADSAYSVLEDFCRLYVGRELVPVLRGLATPAEESSSNGAGGLFTIAKLICDFMGWPEDGPAWEDANKLARQVHEPAYRAGWSDREDDILERCERIAPAEARSEQPEPGMTLTGFQWNDAWGSWEQVIPEAIGCKGVFATYFPTPPKAEADHG